MPDRMLIHVARRRASCLTAGLVALAFGLPALAAPTVAKLDAQRSELHARLYKSGVASGLAHNHVVEATAMAGTVTYDPEAPASFEIAVTVPVASFKADAARLRHRYQLEGTLDKDDRETIEENLRAKDQLNAKKFPTITFKSTAVTQTGPGKYTVKGDLTIRGKTRSVELPTTVTMGPDGFEGTGKLRINHKMFGFEPYSAMLGAIKNQEKIDLILKLVAPPG